MKRIVCICIAKTLIYKNTVTLQEKILKSQNINFSAIEQLEVTACYKDKYSNIYFNKKSTNKDTMLYKTL